MITIFLLAFVVVGVLARIVLRRLFCRIGYDQWVYQRLYDREKFWMSKSERRHMREKFGVID